mmetsp:Transcript_2328/g.8215  ORF Transcript_2328/g.8215 Transcript_2328/m.8215 type:complete len:206 (-) Transcript_2328:239-856(-)
MESQLSTAHMPSFSRTWSLPVPKLSSPHTEHLPASIRFPKYFHPVGVSKHSTPSFSATRSRAAAVGMDRATPLSPPAKYGMHLGPYAAMMATESQGVTKNLFPRIMLRSPSPSDAAPKSGASSAYITSTSSLAYVRLGSGWPPPKSSRGTQFLRHDSGAPRRSHSSGLAYAPVMACSASNVMEKSGRLSSPLMSPMSNTSSKSAL